MKHIAYIAAEYPHENLPSAGGIGSFIKTMAVSLVSQGYQATIFLCLADEDKVWYDDEIKIVQIKKSKPSRLSAFKDRIAIAKTIKQHVKKDSIDLVEAPDWEGLHAFCNLNIPLVTRIHGSVTYFNHIQNVAKPKVIFFFEKKALKRSDKIISVSDYSGQLTKVIFSLKTPIETIYNGVDLTKFSAVNENQVSNKNILYFGTLVRKKGVLELAHIFNELHKINTKAKLILVGKDANDVIEHKSTWSLMQAILTDSAIKNVTYKGAVPYNEMKHTIAESQVCVFPSFAEAFPISWLEAMALEKPIVASSIGWAKESIIDKESGLLEHPENHVEFALKLDRVLNDEHLSGSLAIAAKQRIIDFFDQDKLLKQSLETYKRLTSK